ncbi:MAG: bifunctional oligoribonuclease/PAP phosphatase NrnA [Chlamydiales bacterium]|nr:bifunctional oligoribonuclease/PAP phosphatase NrnA [Chlamydiales bacterium]
MWREIKRILQKHDHFLVTTHVNPDGDGVGAACALTELLLHRGKHVRFVCDSPVPNKLRFLDYHGLHEQFDPHSDYSEVEVVIVLDANRRERVGGVGAILDRPGVISICIDHHQITNCFADVSAIDPRACSVGAMIYTLCKEFGFDINRQAAYGIYTSILCDTGRFSYSSTTRKAHKIADECIKLGVDPDQMYDQLFQQLTVSQLQIFSRALQGMELHLGNRVLVQVLRLEECRAIGIDAPELENLDLEYILEFDKSVGDIECVALLREVGHDKVRISLRATADLDLTSLTHTLGGGGHPKAAGALVMGSIEEVKRKLLEGLEAVLAQPI